ncbi:chromate transporter, chromate ion transporter (CHR) family [Ferrimonas balearica DSM 9799]|uniref:Chromate transporter, chromate ion transporter (CHR) family n=1 Tax=Ferrimonas balearica (strain DSM 9799 / CCM 4581 / KCTC 23876 / PAT) TaxID=550540 RepID=E1SUI4_FERBD|nr:chromate efflux transporter [Ferrimonas balearica]ADN77291.1 chromate transporter, chromate ion transporter (CHR) family [Ferrimonas balearica DSM 9799]
MQRVMQVFLQFLMLGLVSFGGPAAHIGYFRKKFVEQEKWLDDDAYGRLVALSQFLPGPGSSQVGFALGYRRAGVPGAVAAFLGFTLPSFVLLYLLVTLSVDALDSPMVEAVIHGLKLLAVVVVADAVLGMSRSFCKTGLHWALAVLSAAVLLVFPGLAAQLAVLAFAAFVAAWQAREGKAPVSGGSARVHWLPFALLALAVTLAVVPATGLMHRIYADFFQAGALVFGGGHVVLPLLQETTGELISPDRFLTGYAAAQAVPGPMFTLATFLGADLAPQAPLLGATVATLALFLPGLLLVLVFYHGWEALAARPRVAAAAAGINAAVVGLLLSALYQPVFVSAVLAPVDMAMVVVGFYLLRQRQLPILWLIAVMLGMSLLRWSLG